MANMIVCSIVSGIICCVGWIGIYNLIYDKIVRHDTLSLFLVTTSIIVTVLGATAHMIGIDAQYTILFITIGSISTIVTFYGLVALMLGSFLVNNDLQCR